MRMERAAPSGEPKDDGYEQCTEADLKFNVENTKPLAGNFFSGRTTKQAATDDNFISVDKVSMRVELTGRVVRDVISLSGGSNVTTNE
jgi:hypothetical protein